MSARLQLQQQQHQRPFCRAAASAAPAAPRRLAASPATTSSSTRWPAQQQLGAARTPCSRRSSGLACRASQSYGDAYDNLFRCAWPLPAQLGRPPSCSACMHARMRVPAHLLLSPTNPLAQPGPDPPCSRASWLSKSLTGVWAVRQQSQRVASIACIHACMHACTRVCMRCDEPLPLTTPPPLPRAPRARARAAS